MPADVEELGPDHDGAVLATDHGDALGVGGFVQLVACIPAPTLNAGLV